MQISTKRYVSIINTVDLSYNIHMETSIIGSHMPAAQSSGQISFYTFESVSEKLPLIAEQLL